MTRLSTAMLFLASLCPLWAEDWEGIYQAESTPTLSSPRWLEDVPSGFSMNADVVDADGKKVLCQTLSQTERGGWRVIVGDSPMTASSAYTLETRVRVTGETGYLAGLELRFPEIGWVCLRVSPQKVELYTTVERKTLAVDGTEFHTYRIVAEGSQARLYIDGDTGPSLTVNGTTIDKGNFLGFGDYGNLNGEGKAEYEYVRWASEARPPKP